MIFMIKGEMFQCLLIVKYHTIQVMIKTIIAIIKIVNIVFIQQFIHWTLFNWQLIQEVLTVLLYLYEYHIVFSIDTISYRTYYSYDIVS